MAPPGAWQPMGTAAGGHPAWWDLRHWDTSKSPPNILKQPIFCATGRAKSPFSSCPLLLALLAPCAHLPPPGTTKARGSVFYSCLMGWGPKGTRKQGIECLGTRWYISSLPAACRPSLPCLLCKVPLSYLYFFLAG